MADPTLLLIRHAETPNTQAKRITGALDVPLSEAGRHHFESTVLPVARRYPLALIVSSPLARARETAGILWTASDSYPPYTRGAVDVDLRPWNEGPAVQGRLLTAELKHYLSELEQYRDLTPQGGESFRVFGARTLGCLRRLLKQAGAVRDQGAVAVVTHSRNIEVALAWHKAGMRGVYFGPVDHGGDPPGGLHEWRYRGGHWLVRMV